MPKVFKATQKAISGNKVFKATEKATGSYTQEAINIMKKASLKSVLPTDFGNPTVSSMKKRFSEQKLKTTIPSVSYDESYVDKKSVNVKEKLGGKSLSDFLTLETAKEKAEKKQPLTLAERLALQNEPIKEKDTPYIAKGLINNDIQEKFKKSEEKKYFEKAKYYFSLPDGQVKSTNPENKNYGLSFDNSIDWKYEYINNINGIRNTIKAQIARGGNGKEYRIYDNMSEREIGIYNYIYETEGKKKANEFLNFLESDLDFRVNQDIAENSRKIAEKAPVLSTVISPIGTVASAAEQVLNYGEFLLSGKMKTNKMATATSTIRSTVSDKVNWEIGNWDAFDFVYNTVMSGVDSAVLSPFGGVGAAALGLSAAANTTNDILQRGGDSIQAFLGGAASGVFEGFFEKFSISQLNSMKDVTVKGFKDYAQNLVKSMATNCSEETATEVANILYDYAVNGGISNYSIMVQKLMSKGDSVEVAKKKAANKLGLQVLEAGASGALMGFGFASISSTGSYRKYKKETPFAKQVDDVISGTHDVNYDLYVSETPELFTNLGFTDSPLLMRNSKVKEILKKHSEMSVDTIKKIPEAIKNPILVLKSKTHPTQSVVAITDIKTDKGNMIVPIWVNQSGNYIDIDLGVGIKTDTNFIASAYGRDLKILLEYANENDGFLYQNEDIKKVRQLLTRYGLQLPTPLKLSDSNITISQNDNNVNNIISNESGNDTPNLQQQSGNRNALTEYEKKLLNTPDSELTPEQRAVKQSIIESRQGDFNNNSKLQTGVNNDIIGSEENSNTIRGEENGSTNTELLERGEISATNRSGNGVRQQSENSRKIEDFLRNDKETQGVHRKKSAGDSGWVHTRGEKGSRFEISCGASFLRGIRGIKLRETDTVGRTLSDELQNKLKDTILKDKNGRILSLYHFTDSVFDIFTDGDIGFHFGTLDAANNRRNDPYRKKRGDAVIYKEAYINMQNPIMIDGDRGVWDAFTVGDFLLDLKILSETEIKHLEKLEGYYKGNYNSEASVKLRELLKAKGYDGIIYTNAIEDDISIIAFDADQILTVAENGVLKEGCGVTEGAVDTQTDEEVSADEGERTGISTFGGLDTVKGKHLNQAQQEEIREIGNKLGRTVIYEDFYKQDKFKRKKKIPDGYIDKDGNIHINFYAKRPVYFIFKHEITHYLKRKLSAYTDFMDMALNSKAFSIWLHNKGYSSINDLKAEIMDTYSEVEGFNEAKAYDEILADFVGERLFGGKNAISTELMNALEPKQKRTFLDVIRSIIDYFKSKFSNESKISVEINRLEKEFIKVYNEAVNTSVEETSMDDGEMFSIAGMNSKTANKSKMISAMKRVLNGEDAETVRKDTGWYKGKDGKWRYYIPDNMLNIDSLENLGDNTDFLGNCIQHDNLFEAYPELKNIKIRFDDIGQTKNGKFISESNEIILSNRLKGNTEKIKDTLVHEVQHAIQNIEGFAEGGNKNLGFAYAMNRAYEKAKNSQEFNVLSKKEKFRYILSIAYKDFNAKNTKELKYKAYQSIYGETEARQVTRNRQFDEELLELAQPDMSGNIVDATIEAEKFVENFEGMGYTEKEIRNLLGGADSEKQGSIRDIESASGGAKEKSGRGPNKRELDIGLAGSGIDAFRGRNKESPTKEERGVQSSVSTNDNARGMVRGVEEDYSIPTAEIDRKEVLTRLANGQITVEEAENILNRQKTQTPIEIADLTEDDANTTPYHSRKNGESDGDETSKFYGSLLESDIFDERFKNEVRTDSFIEKYKSVTNKETLKTAAKELDEGGLSYVSKWWTIKPDRASLIDTAVGFILMDRYQRVGDYESATAAAEKVREFGTAGGQQVQIFSIIGRFDANAMAVYAQKELTQAFEVMAKGKTKKWIDDNKGKFKLTEDEIELIRRYTLQAALFEDNTRPKAIALAKIQKVLQEKIPPEKGNGIRAFQRIAMLLNLRTFNRNINGNASMVGTFIVSDFFGSVIDKVVSKKTGVRTTGNFDIKSVKGFKKGLYETLDDFKRGIHTKQEELNRFDINSSSGKNFNENGNGLLGTAFMKKQLNDCAKFLNKLDNFTSFALEIGDRPFFEMWYMNALNNQLKLNNTDIPTTEMMEIAKEEALRRTWQDDNIFTRSASQIRKSFNVVRIPGTTYGLGDFVYKFIKTPTNIAKAIVEISPVGFAGAVSNAQKMKNAIETGQFTPKMQKDYVQSLSNAITGTLLYTLVAIGASLGLVKLSGDGEEDKDVANYEKYIMGIPPYSIEFLGANITYDWMQPFGSVLAVVAEYTENREKNPDENAWGAILEAAKAGGKVFAQQSFIQGLYDLCSTDDWVEGITSIALAEPSAFIPQAFSQTASLFDEYRRTSYDATNGFKTAINDMIAKIPYLRTKLPKQVNVLGEDVKNTQYLNPWLAFASPWNTYPKSSSEVIKEIYKVYKSTGENSVIPKTAPKEIKVKGNTIAFSPQEKADFQREMGGQSAQMLAVLFDTHKYSALSDQQKVKVIEDIYDYSYRMAKSQLEYDYETLSAMVGEKKNGEPILTKSVYSKLNEERLQELAQEYFLSKAEMRYLNDYDRLIQYYIIRLSK